LVFDIHHTTTKNKTNFIITNPKPFLKERRNLMQNAYRLILAVLFFIGGINFAYAQVVFTVSGTVTNSETGDAISGATVTLSPGSKKATTNAEGKYTISSLTAGTYTAEASGIGYTKGTETISVTGDMTVNFALVPGSVKTDEIIVEINRAKERETPVAFTDISSKTIDARIHGQDAPLLARGVPGLYAYSTDGAGNGESQLLVRGFSQNYVQVLINGIPTNDPESNSVYWSNWGAVSGNAGSIQIQRGAGSSLYGSGSFGGSFNILTENPSLQPFYGANLSLGDPMNTVYGIKLASGLLSGKFAAALNVDRKIAEGTRVSGRYEGLNYYTSLSYFFNNKNSLKFVLHGAPQVHGYSFSQDVIYFAKFGYKANPANFLPLNVVEQLPANKLGPNYGLLDGRNDLKDSKFVNLAHNFFHKPQAELHYTYDINEKSIFRTTAFLSLGRGGGSSLNSPGAIFTVRRPTTGNNGTSIDTITLNRYGSEGYITDLANANIYLSTAFQRNSYSLHSQYGILSNYQTQVSKTLNLTAGFEIRNWRADHPGHFTNLYGKDSVTQTYGAYKTSSSTVADTSFTRSVFQGDIDRGDADVGSPFDFSLSTTDPTYRSQYRNYLGETPQLTLFTQANWFVNKLNIMASLQYVWYKYTLTENMPSENSIGLRLTPAQVTALGITQEGPAGNGKFYMRSATGGRWYEFNLVNASRSRGFFQPKLGFNYNVNENWNFFGNFAHVERFIDLGVYYNQGAVNTAAEDEKSNQFEAGFGYSSADWFAKINGYWMIWDNKAARIQDITKAGQPGYDRNGFRSELVGQSTHRGIEVEFNARLDKVTKIKGLGLRGSVTFMDNKWTDVLASVQTEVRSNGLTYRRAFNTGSRDLNGNIDTLFFDELKDTYVKSGPQTMVSLGLTYDWNSWFAGVDMNFAARDYLLDGATYTAVSTVYQGTNPVNGRDYYLSTYDNQLPTRAIFNAYAGYNFALKNLFKGTVSLQSANLFDKDFFASSDNFGVIPGEKRTFRFNLSIGL